MEHHFNVEIAKLVGVEKAILLYNINYWCVKNEANESNFHDGNYWTYNSAVAFEKLFPYMAPRSISRWLSELEKDGWIMVGNYNKDARDRTRWYCSTSLYSSSIRQNGGMQKAKTAACISQNDKCISQNGEPLPDSKLTDSKQIEEEKLEKEKVYSPKSIPPEKVEVAKYFHFEKGFEKDLAKKLAREFYSFYEMKGWLVGKVKMKNWKIAASRSLDWVSMKKIISQPPDGKSIPPNAIQSGPFKGAVL